MAAQKAVHASIQAEVQEDAPRVAQHHDEGHQRTAGLANLHVAKVTPVHLCLFAWQGTQSQVGFGCRARSVAGDDVAKVVDATDKAGFAHHGMKSTGRECGELGQRLQYEGQVRIDPPCTLRAQGVHDAGCAQHAPYGGVVHAQLARDGAHAPALSLEQAKDLRTQFRGYGHGLGCAVKNAAERALHMARNTSGNARQGPRWWPWRK